MFCCWFLICTYFLQVMAFYDVKPQAPIHFLVIPKKPIAGLRFAEDTDTQVTAT